MSKTAVCYCEICRWNHEDGRKHVRFPRHQKELKKRLDREKSKLQEYAKLWKSPVFSCDNIVEKDKQWCLFCSCDVVRDPKQGFVGEHIIRHLHDKEHERNLRKFAYENGMETKLIDTFLLSNSDFMHFQLTSSRMWQARLLEGDQDQNPTKDGVIEQKQTLEISLGIATQHESLPPPPKPRVYKTVVNRHGVRQNPTGKDENGERVWGGGIYKYRNMEDWIAWPIDLDDEGEDNVSRMGNEKVHRNQAAFVEETEDDDGKPIFTESASGEGVTFITPQKLRLSEGNIHTGATPPWLRKDEADESQEAELQKKRFPIVRNKEGMPIPFVYPEDKKKPSDPEASTDPNWLPNFGRVWQSGTRKDTQKEFFKERKSTSKLQAAIRSSTTQLETKAICETGNERNQLGTASTEGKKKNTDESHRVVYLFHNPVYTYPDGHHPPNIITPEQRAQESVEENGSSAQTSQVIEPSRASAQPPTVSSDPNHTESESKLGVDALPQMNTADGGDAVDRNARLEELSRRKQALKDRLLKNRK